VQLLQEQAERKKHPFSSFSLLASNVGEATSSLGGGNGAMLRGLETLEIGITDD